MGQNMKRYSGFILLISIFLFSTAAFSKDITGGNLTLTIHEGSGRFSLYAVDSSQKKVPLFLDKDPRTSYITILAGNKIYRMGDTFEFRQNVEYSENGAKITWTSRSYSITQDFTFVTPLLNSDSTALRIKLTIENLSENTVEIGARYLIDTHLGEKNIHFYADQIPVNAETAYVDTPPKYLLSTDDKNNLVLFTNRRDVTSADKIVLANWKRLNDAGWTYNENTSRNFSMQPYSINDSAIAMYYDPVTAAQGDAITVTLLLGTSKLIEETASGSTDTAETQTESEKREELVRSILDDLSTLGKIIERIDAIVASGREPTVRELKEMQEAVMQLMERKSRYEQ